MSYYENDSRQNLPYCDTCDETFSDEPAIIWHLKNSNQHCYCTSCCRDFPSYAARQHHWTTDPHHEFTYCDRCNRHFNSREKMLEHKRLTPSQHYMCWPCDLDFSTSQRLRHHFIEDAVHQSTYCMKCGKNFSNANNCREVC